MNLLRIGKLGLVLMLTARATMPVAAADIANELELGRALFDGTRVFSAAPKVAGVTLPLTNAYCAACHGAQGQGRTEGGVIAPPLQWRMLTNTRANLPAYGTNERILTAIEQGGARAQGASLSPPMPQFTLSDTERRALLAYLQVVGTEAAPVRGLSPEVVILGAALPLSGADAPAGQAALQAMRTRLSAINTAGGIFGRTLELRVADSAPSGIDAAVLELVNKQRVFAVVGSWMADPSQALTQALVANNTPSVGAIGMPLVPQKHRLTTWLLPSLQQQISTAVTTLQQRCASAAGSEVWHGNDKTFTALAQKDHRLLGSPTTSVLPVRAVQVKQPQQQLSLALRQRAIDKVVALLPAVEVAQMQVSLSSAQWCVATLASVSGVPRAGARDERQVVVFPVPQRALQGTQLWTALGNASIGLLAEGMARAGRVLDQERLVTGIDSLRDFEVAPGLPVRFAPNARHGLTDGFVWQ